MLEVLVGLQVVFGRRVGCLGVKRRLGLPVVLFLGRLELALELVFAQRVPLRVYLLSKLALKVLEPLRGLERAAASQLKRSLRDAVGTANEPMKSSRDLGRPQCPRCGGDGSTRGERGARPTSARAERVWAHAKDAHSLTAAGMAGRPPHCTPPPLGATGGPGAAATAASTARSPEGTRGISQPKVRKNGVAKSSPVFAPIIIWRQIIRTEDHRRCPNDAPGTPARGTRRTGPSLTAS